MFERWRESRDRKRMERKAARKVLEWQDGMTPNTFHRPGRVMLASVEGPRYDPTDFETVTSPDEVTEELERILRS